LEGATNQRPRAGPGCGVQLELAIGVRAELLHPRGAEREHPADIRWGDEVPRRPEHMGAKNRAGVEGKLDFAGSHTGRALAERPLRAGKVLRLNGAEPADDGGGVATIGAQQPLIRQPVEDQALHARTRDNS